MARPLDFATAPQFAAYLARHLPDRWEVRLTLPAVYDGPPRLWITDPLEHQGRGRQRTEWQLSCTFYEGKIEITRSSKTEFPTELLETTVIDPECFEQIRKVLVEQIQGLELPVDWWS